MMLDGGISKNYFLNNDEQEDPTILVRHKKNVGTGAVTPQIFTNFEQ
tara:strand:- start:115 stop:255 length:141 start_codon:yes stop_codon:yes gene_type:complete